MSKHAVADLGQRAQTLAPAVESGGEEAEQNREFVRRAAGSYKLSCGSYCYLVPQSPGTPNPRFHHPLPLWSSARWLLLKTGTTRARLLQAAAGRNHSARARSGPAAPLLTNGQTGTARFPTPPTPTRPLYSAKGDRPGTLSDTRQTLRGEKERENEDF